MKISSSLSYEQLIAAHLHWVTYDLQRARNAFNQKYTATYQKVDLLLAAHETCRLVIRQVLVDVVNIMGDDTYQIDLVKDIIASPITGPKYALFLEELESSSTAVTNQLMSDALNLVETTKDKMSMYLL